MILRRFACSPLGHTRLGKDPARRSRRPSARLVLEDVALLVIQLLQVRLAGEICLAKSVNTN